MIRHGRSLLCSGPGPFGGALFFAALWAAAPSQAFDGAFVPLDTGTWSVDSGPVPFVLEPNGSADIEDGSDLQALRDAFRAWQCVPGTKLRFVEGEGPGPAEVNADDRHTLFWDETGAEGLGPGVLGVTIGNAGSGFADIVFNGKDHTWSTDGSATDVGSIAVHEIGHFIGLGHPCSDANETDCNGPDRSIMTPAWDGRIGRAPLPDDQEGVLTLYPADADDTSTCDGPFRQGERCSCDGDCVEGLVCAATGRGEKLCSPLCASDDSACGGATCVLSPPEGDGPAAGVCIKAAVGTRPAGAVCSNGRECESGACALLFGLGRSLCQEPCVTSADCAAGSCYEGFCLGVVETESCPSPDDEVPPPECGCASTTTSGSGWLPAGGAALLLASLVTLRRRRPPRQGRR